MSIMQSTYQALMNDLEAQKSKLQHEIRNYPPPIPACDAQFNYLLEKRDHLSVEIYQLAQMDVHDADLIQFVQESAFINDHQRTRIIEQLQIDG